MNRVKLPFCVITICCISMLLGCAKNGGKKTFEFLKAEHDIVENTGIELKQCLISQPPTAPDLSKTKPKSRERGAELKKYQDALSAYWNTVIQNSQQAERVLNDAETRISRLDSAGVGEGAINLTKSYERSFGDWVQVYVETEALIKLEQTNLNKNQQSDLIGMMIPGIIEIEASGGLAGLAVSSFLKEFLKGISGEMRQKIEQDQDMQLHLEHLQEAVTGFNHDCADLVTKRSELVTLYRAKYPKFSWDEILPTATQTNTNKVNQ